MATFSTGYSLDMRDLSPYGTYFATEVTLGTSLSSTVYDRIVHGMRYHELAGTDFVMSGNLPSSGTVNSWTYGDYFLMPPIIPELPPMPVYTPWITLSGMAVAAADFSAALSTNTLGALLPAILSSADTINGSASNDYLTGYAGNDIINAGIGLDTLDGGTGADTMTGGAGADVYLVDNYSDVVMEVAGEGTDTVQSSINFSLAGTHVERLTLTGSAAINATGNNANNMLNGNSGANTLNGGLGADTMTGGGGNDTYVVDNTLDKVIETVGAGTDLVQSSVTFSLSGIHAERLTLTGSSAINATGNNAGNSLIGNSAANVLNGGLGVDVMSGGLGNDTYVVDNTGDLISEAAGAGTDTVQSSVTYSLAGYHGERLTLTGSAAINATGNNAANILTGNSGANILSGGLGNDTLIGGAGSDTFLFNSALNGTANVDSITGFSAAADTMQIDDDVFTAAGAVGTLAAGAFSMGTAAADAGDRIIYDSATGKIYYDADGTGAAAKVLFAQVASGLALTNADFHIVG